MCGQESEQGLAIGLCIMKEADGVLSTPRIRWYRAAMLDRRHTWGQARHGRRLVSPTLAVEHMV